MSRGGLRIAIREVGPRDGLQNDSTILSPPVRADLCDRLAATGLCRIEAASFVNAERVPQMARAEEVFAGLHRTPSVTFAALVLNLRGLERALAAGAEEIHVAYPLTDTFASRNQNMTLEEATGAAVQIIGRAKTAGVSVTATLAASFGCPFEGPVDPDVVIDHVERMAAAGADAIMLADTIGVGVPAQVRRLVPAALAVAGGRPIGLHLHNTRNTGYVNAVVGLEHGASILDASIGGLGGCPFAPRASGNIATEDLIYLLDREGVETGVDLDSLISVAEWLGVEVGHELSGLVHRAGPFAPVAG